MTESHPFKSGYVAILGRPNVGKSTLLNQLLGYRLSIVSPKPQTTRRRVLGILHGENHQILFLDTPGILQKTRYALHKRMMEQARAAVQDADVLLFVVEPVEPDEVDQEVLNFLKGHPKPVLLVINKIDTVEKRKLLPVMDAYSKLFPFQEIVPVSALKADGLDVLLRLIVQYLPEGPPYYPEDTLTDMDERSLVAERIRERIFHLYREEIPYSAAVEIEEFIEQDPAHGGKDYIRATIYVERDSQKGILIGKGGEKLRKVGTQVRKEIEFLLGRPVYLELWVKVFPKWRQNPAFLKRLGL